MCKETLQFVGDGLGTPEQSLFFQTLAKHIRKRKPHRHGTWVLFNTPSFPTGHLLVPKNAQPVLDLSWLMRRMIEKIPALPFVAPFALFIALLGLKDIAPIAPALEYPIRVSCVSVAIWLFSRRAIDWRVSRFWQSAAVGVAVFMIWVGPDILWNGYHNQALFRNSLLGSPASSIPQSLRSGWAFLAFRVLGTAIVVPIIEELFWRVWLMRYLIAVDFTTIPLGSYAPFAFWCTAVLFATEHGSYWDVGLAAGIVYNCWMLRNRSMADCMIAHGITNLCLATYVVAFQQWQYWL